MPRLIYIVAILLLIWFAFKYFRTQIKAKENENNHTVKPIKDVKPCALCGIHIPVEEMVKKDGHSFCCYKHMQEYEDRKSSN